MRSRPSLWPSGERCTSPALRGSAPPATARSPPRAPVPRASVSILSAVYSRSETPLQSSSTTFGLGESTIGHILFADMLGVGEEDRAPRIAGSAGRETSHRPDSPADSGRKTLVPGLRPKHVHRRDAPADRRAPPPRARSATRIPLQRAQQHHAGERGNGPHELHASGSVRSRGIPPDWIKADRVDDDDGRQRRLRHQAEQRRQEQHGHQRGRAR